MSIAYPKHVYLIRVKKIWDIYGFVLIDLLSFWVAACLAKWSYARNCFLFRVKFWGFLGKEGVELNSIRSSIKVLRIFMARFDISWWTFVWLLLLWHIMYWGQHFSFNHELCFRLWIHNNFGIFFQSFIQNIMLLRRLKFQNSASIYQFLQFRLVWSVSLF